MNFGNIFQAVNEQIFLRELIQFTPDNFDELKQYFNIVESFEELKLRFEKYDADINKLYANKNGFNLYWYVQDNALTEFHTLYEDEFIYMNLKERLAAQEEHLKDLREKGDYESYFGSLYLIAPNFTFDMYERLFEEIPEDLKYKIFRDIYVNAEYGFQKLNKDIVEQAFKLNKDKSFKETLSTNKQGYLTVYRGMGESSTSIESAYSWTLSLAIASNFAAKFSMKGGKVVKANIHIDNVIDYITDRREAEVLLFPEFLENVEDLKLINLDTIWTTMGKDTHMPFFDFYNQNYILNEWFMNPKGIHGVAHARRVLFHCMAMAHLRKMSPRDMTILAYGAIYHDIGRDSDDRDDWHGRKSLDKIKKNNLFKNTKSIVELDKEAYEIIKIIIEYHSKRDEEGLVKINETKAILDKKHAKELFMIFKDCDGLERCRIRDLDTRYLRTETARQLVLVAYQLHQGMKY